MAAQRDLSVALVVDDEPLIVTSIARTLKSHGVRDVRVAYSVQEACERLADGIDLVLCDLCLGGMQAHEVFRQASALQRPPCMIAISGQASRAEVFELMCWGVAAYLEKPFTPDELLACIESATEPL